MIHIFQQNSSSFFQSLYSVIFRTYRMVLFGRKLNICFLIIQNSIKKKCLELYLPLSLSSANECAISLFSLLVTTHWYIPWSSFCTESTFNVKVGGEDELDWRGIPSFNQVTTCCEKKQLKKKNYYSVLYPFYRLRFSNLFYLIDVTINARKIFRVFNNVIVSIFYSSDCSSNKGE